MPGCRQVRLGMTGARQAPLPKSAVPVAGEPLQVARRVGDQRRGLFRRSGLPCARSGTTLAPRPRWPASRISRSGSARGRLARSTVLAAAPARRNLGRSSACSKGSRSPSAVRSASFWARSAVSSMRRWSPTIVGLVRAPPRRWRAACSRASAHAAWPGAPRRPRRGAAPDPEMTSRCAGEASAAMSCKSSSRAFSSARKLARSRSLTSASSRWAVAMSSTRLTSRSSRCISHGMAGAQLVALGVELGAARRDARPGAAARSGAARGAQAPPRARATPARSRRRRGRTSWPTGSLHGSGTPPSDANIGGIPLPKTEAEGVPAGISRSDSVKSARRCVDSGTVAGRRGVRTGSRSGVGVNFR